MLSSSQIIPNTAALHLQEERMTRTKEVKKRLSPIMERMKSSLARIQDLEESLQLENEQEQQSETAVAVPGLERSRTLLKRSMEMLKKKLYALQKMEEMWYTEEDRRQNLQHYFLQISLSKPCLELAAAKRQNQELSRDVQSLEKERTSLEERCAMVDELEKRVAVLSEKLREHQKLRAELDQTTSQRDLLELDLVQRQSKITQQAIRIDDLECQVEQLTSVCDGLTRNLQLAEVRGDELERNLLELKNANNVIQRGRSGPPRTIRPKASSDSDSTKSTENSTDETLDTDYPTGSLPDIAKTVSPAKTADTADSSLLSYDGSVRLPGDVDTSAISIFEDDDCSAIGPEGEDATIDRLTTRVAELRLKNAGLVRSQQENFSKFHALLQDNARQAARIQELERQLDQKKTTEPAPAPTSPPQERQRRGYFLKRLLTSDAAQLKQMIEGGSGGANADKARQISQDLAARSQEMQ